MFDLSTAPKMSWVGGNLMPIIPMYHTTGPNLGKLNAFFFGLPGC